MINLDNFLKNFSFDNSRKTAVSSVFVNNVEVKLYVNEYWTSKQRQGNSVHEVSYRACFKPQLPNFFINIFSKPGDVVYDPFNGRGTTVVEAALNGRKIIANDINPLSLIFTEARFRIPTLQEIETRLNEIFVSDDIVSEIDLTMFYDKITLKEILSLKKYLTEKKVSRIEDFIDKWIRMVATNRLTGHSKGFFSVYTLPPNQAVSQKRQIEINKNRNQIPEYRNTKKLILNKSKSLLKNISENDRQMLSEIYKTAVFLNYDARNVPEILSETVQLTVTSPPFLDIVQYADDNWLRCWFNGIDVGEVSKKITMSKSVSQWQFVMAEVFTELFRITKRGGYVAFEVGELRNGKIKLEEYVVPLGINAGFECKGIIINEQNFTKTANIWGVDNNMKGTNSNRIVVFYKE